MSVISSSHTRTAGSHTWGSGLSDSAHGPSSMRRRRTKLASDRKIADDEFMAAAIGDVEWLKQSLKDAGPEINFDKNGLTAIHLAAIHGRLECLKVCIEKFKIDINLASSTGWRPIHLCISNQTGKRSLQCLAYLLDKSADSSIINDDGITPVHQAASEGHVQCLKMLLEIGAKIDGKDCRNNTPLDLAKLWGHRKCARILAAEMWHQDKDSVAKEMKQLKKVKMQQVLQELEDEEEMKAAQQFYGEQAFKQWMEARSLTDPKKAQEKRTSKESLMKPNSVAKKGDGTGKKPQLKSQISMDARKMTDTRTQETYTAESDGLVSDAELLKGLCDDTADKSAAEKKKPKPYEPVNHSSDWNKSIKVKGKTYVPNLNDDFPRDEFTIMPRIKGMPKHYEGKFVRPLTPSNIDEDIKSKGTHVALRKPKLPQEVIEKVLSGDLNIDDRGMIFKCKHIGDVHAKKKYDIDQKGRSETAFHLTDDVSSHLVKNSVRPAKKALVVSPSKTQSTHSVYSDSEWMTDTYPLPMVMDTLKQMSKPTRFPNTFGNEYLFNFGDIK